jgi:hypothetical protein
VATAIAIHAGNSQEAPPARPVSIRPAVRITDQAGQPFAGAQVTFEVKAGGGTVEGATATSDANGVATVGKWTLGRLEGANQLEARSGSLTPANITATARFERGSIPSTDLEVTVQLPSGSALALGQLEAANMYGAVPIGTSGTFSLPFVQEGPQLAFVSTPSDATVLMGWIDPTHRTINARTTAEVLVFFDLGLYRISNAANRRKAREVIATRNAELAPIEAAVAAALRAPLETVTLETAALDAARKGLRQGLAQQVGQSGPATATKIDPVGEFSGLAVDDSTYQHIRIANWFRRRVIAFIDRISYIPAAGGAALPAFQEGDPIKIGASNGLTTAIGGLIDAATGSEAGEPAIVGPLPTPLYPPTARRTTYKVTVVGAGGKQNSRFDELTPARKDLAKKIAVESFLLETIVPLAAAITSGLNDIHDSYFKEPEFLADLDKFFDALPHETLEKAGNGDWFGASTSFLKQLAVNGIVQEAFLDVYLNMMARKGLHTPHLKIAAGEKLIKILGRLDIAFTVSDVFLGLTQVGYSQKAETWDVQVNASKIKIKEGSQKVSLGDHFLFHAVILDAVSGSAATFKYKWTTTGGVSFLTAPGGVRTTTLEGPSDVVDLGSDFKNYGTDKLMVEVFQTVDGKSVSIGADTVNFEVVRGEVLLVPNKISIKSGENYTFKVRVADARLIGGALSYRWSTSGRYGRLEGGATAFETTSPTVIYTARSDGEGSDVVAVEVISTASTVRTSLGKSSAAVLVERKKTVMLGSTTVISTSWPEAGGTRVCMSFVVDVPLVEGGTEYSVKLYGFTDPTGFYKSGHTFTFRPPLTPFVECTARVSGVAGQVGGVYRRMLTQGSGNVNPPKPSDFTSRFTGIVVEVTVKY